MTLEVKWAGWGWFGKQQFFRLFGMYRGWMWACGPINFIYYRSERR